MGFGASRLDVRLVPAALVSWIVTAAGIVWPIGNVCALCCVVVALGGGALWWCVARRSWHAPRLGSISAGLVAVGMVGAGYGLAVALRSEAVDRHPITVAFGTSALVTVTPSESPVSLGRGRLMFRATVQRLRDDETSGRVVVFARALDFGELMVGQPVQFRARISRPARHDLTVAVFNATGRPTVGRAGPVHRAAHIVRHRFAAAVREVLPADQATMLPALVLGDTSTVTALTSREFRAAGLTHLTAVSGANVTIVCAAALVSARLIGPRAAVVCAAVALVAFVILVQPTASVLRAAVMGAIALVGMLSARRRQAIPALSGSVLVLLAAAPHLAVDIGFALSVAATGALVVIAPVWSRRLVDRGCPKVLADALAVAAAAQLVTAPLVAAISGRVSRGGQSGGGGRDRADHRAGQRCGRAGRAVAGRRAGADPVHRARSVVGVARGALGVGCARGDRSGGRRSARRTAGRWRHRVHGCAVALALVSRGHVQNDGGGRHMSACLVAVRAGRPFVTPSWGERG